MQTFDELFNEFFKRNNIKPEDKIDSSLKDEAKKMIDLLTNFNVTDNIDEAIEKEIDASLGKPDEILFYNEGNMYFEKRIWHTATGDLVKLIVSDDPSILVAPAKPKTLQEQLDEAVETENFEKAAAIRDAIKKSKRKPRVSKKKSE